MKKLDYDIIEIDFYNDDHIDKCLNLLNKIFVSENFTKKWWIWKYQHNPFGKSFGWAAKLSDNENFIGIRILWPWILSKKGSDKLFYQSVDTVTDYDYMRKGIFSALTKEAIKVANNNGFFIYNFPNKNSYPGCKKLGWQDIIIKKTSLELVSLKKIPILLCKFIFYIFFKNRCVNLQLDDKFRLKSLNIILDTDVYHTKWYYNIIKWRFMEHPLYKYYYFSTNNGQIIYKINIKYGLSEAQIVISNVIDICIFKEYKYFLYKAGIDFFSYNGLDDKTNKYFQNSAFSVKINRTINYVMKVPKGINNLINIRLESGEMDYF